MQSRRARPRRSDSTNRVSGEVGTVQIFKNVFPFVVITDIANFFDSVLHRRLAEAFHMVAAPEGLLGLLFFLLERLSVRPAFGESPQIGLPVDEFDCSRTLAHLFLFPHDHRMRLAVGEAAYVRWMDDQILGAPTKAKGLLALSAVAKSLELLHLTPNSSKSRILALADARRHFHLDLNDALQKLEGLPCSSTKDRRLLAGEVRKVWARAVQHEAVGEWDKILKRIYRLAGLARARWLRRRALRDVHVYPHLAQRIAAYIRCSGLAREFVDFALAVWKSEEQIHGDVNLLVLEGLLRLEPEPDESRLIRAMASRTLRPGWDVAGSELCKPVAPLLLLRFGDRRSLPLLRATFEGDSERRTPNVTRAAAMVFASFGGTEVALVRRAASRHHRNSLAAVVRLVERLQSSAEVPDRLKARLQLHWDPVSRRQFVDMRTIVIARLLARSTAAPVRDLLTATKGRWLLAEISDYDRKLISRLLP